MSFIQFCNTCRFFTLVELLISLSLGLFSFSIAVQLTQSAPIKNGWYTSLKYILTGLAISGVSNAYTILILGTTHIEPTEFFLNVSLLSLLIWCWSFYRCKLTRQHKRFVFEKILKFLHGERLNNKSASR